MNVFLTGATGYIGGAIADALQHTGHTVLGLAYSEKSAKVLQARSRSPLRGDLRDPASLAKGCAGYLEYPFEIKRKIYRFKYSSEVYFQLPPRGILSTKDLLSDVDSVE